MKYAFKFACHVGLVFCAFILAYALRRGLGIDWWLSEPMALRLVIWGAAYAAIAGALEAFFRTERTAWRFTSAREVVRLAQATALTALLFLLLIFLSNRAITLPRSTLLLSWLLSLCALVGVRLAWRVTFDRSLAALIFLPDALRRRRSARPLVVVGHITQAEAYLRRHAADGGLDYQPVGIVTPGGNLVGQFVHGVRVLGTIDDMEAVLREAARQARGPAPLALLFLSDPVLDLGLTSQQIGRLRVDGVQLLRQPSLAEMKKGAPAALRELRLEEFLPRKPVTLDPSPIEQLVRGRRVLVTGAGGSIGSEVCRQLIAFGCGHLSMIDHSEFLLFEIDREIGFLQHQGSRRAVLCNVRDAARVRAVFDEEQPEIVFHAAALKHVNLVEEHPGEGVLTNVKGTWHVVEAARGCGAAQMVLISTDKAVNPTSVMGATKRVAEALLPTEPGETRFCAVRFGNVLGSAGSVVPIFQRQIERGGPVTVTHQDVERYFMTIPEAVQLVLHATVLSAAAENDRPRKFTLEMGEPVKIIDLARQMIEICGLRAGEDIQIEITGLKPGEKLTEELVDTDETAVPCMTFISEIAMTRDGKAGRLAVQALIEAAESAEPDELAEQVMAAVATIRGEGRKASKAMRLARA